MADLDDRPIPDDAECFECGFLKNGEGMPWDEEDPHLFWGPEGEILCTDCWADTVGPE